jgi:hypothetical protein
MASRTKKKAKSDSVTFKKSELVSKLKDFLESEGACDGDWVNKIRVEFLGEKPATIVVDLQYQASVEIEMVTDDTPSEEEIKDRILNDLSDGMLDIDVDYEDFKIVSIKKSA